MFVRPPAALFTDSWRTGIREAVWTAGRRPRWLDARHGKKYAVSEDFKVVELGCGLKTHSGSTEIRIFGRAGVVLAPAFFFCCSGTPVVSSKKRT